MAHRFNIIIRAEIELNTEVDANTEAEARELAILELRSRGDISNIEQLRNMMLDEEVDNELLRLAENHSRLYNTK